MDPVSPPLRPLPLSVTYYRNPQDDPAEPQVATVISGILGGAVGVLAMLVMPSFPASDYLNAIAVGIVSGLAATGANQIGKKLKNK